MSIHIFREKPIGLGPFYHKPPEEVPPTGRVRGGAKVGPALLKEKAKEALLRLPQLKPTEKVCVIYDSETAAVAEAFMAAGREIGSKAIFYKLTEGVARLEDPALLSFIDGSSSCVFINAFTEKTGESPQRMALLGKEYSHPEARMIHCPGITPQTLSLDLDYDAMVARARKIMPLLAEAEEVEISTASRTSFRLKISGRPVVTEFREIHPDRRRFDLPLGEVFCAPIEESGNGVLVVDGTIGEFGIPSPPLRITVVNGHIDFAQLEKDNPSYPRLAELITQLKIDRCASILAEFGIGLLGPHPLSGHIVVDEKCLETIHIAFGKNYQPAQLGGKNVSEVHRDFVIAKPTVVLVMKDGSRLVLLKDGKLQV
ncbi:MAG: aminopeptidase [Candidatus Saganbacteria bacterium]|nr:aminopeptidase [Candidatus Saganbacteria bacterium]